MRILFTLGCMKSKVAVSDIRKLSNILDIHAKTIKVRVYYDPDWRLNGNGSAMVRNTFTGEITSIDINTSEGDVTTVLLHEVGHCIDRTRKGNEAFSYECEIKKEITAWKYAIALANEYGLKLDVNVAKTALKGYSRDFDVPIDLKMFDKLTA